MDYCLGFHSPPHNNKAQKGTIVHKALELLAQSKITRQRGEKEFKNDELGRTFSITEINPDLAIELAYQFYVSKKQYEYTNRDFEDCKQYMWEALLWKNGMFSPLKLNILESEKFFDIQIKQPWAIYNYKLPDGHELNGYLGLKGTMDLVVQRDNEIIEVIDWKTGSRKDWSKGYRGGKKGYDDFYKDPQLRLYHYAASQVYPKANQIFFTIFWLQDGGPFTICFQRSDLESTEEMLKRRFEAIRNTYKPKIIYPNDKCGWCYFSKNSFDGPTDDYSKSICNQVHKEILQLGIDKVTMMRAKNKEFNSYGEGGGKTHD